MTLPVVFTANGQTAYNLTKSLRFRSSASAYLNRTLTTPTNNKIWTWSGWIKIGLQAATGNTGGYRPFFGAGNNASTNYTRIGTEGGSLRILQNTGVDDFNLYTTQVIRDYAAWYHFVVAVDTTQATASNRIKLYINGTQVTAFATANYPTQNLNTIFNSATPHFYANAPDYPTFYFDGYQAETNFIDGQALTPSSFGSTNALTGVWQPAKYTGTYGTNGFYLPFTNTTSTTTLGYDFSGNSNNWTTNNLSLTTGSTYDSMTDVPTLTSATTANYAVLNPDQPASVLGNLAYTKITNGNLNVELVAGSSTDLITPATFSVTTGTYYYEFKLSATGSGNNYHSVGVYNGSQFTGQAQYLNSAIYYWERGSVRVNGTFVSTGLATCVAGDVIGVALNCTTGAISFYKNNTLLYTASSLAYTIYTPLITGEGGGSFNIAVNFGQQGFTYTPPTGFVALNTYNLPTSTIVKGNTVMDATLYTGTGANLTITNTAGFKPDFVWTKCRSGASTHLLFDSIRGVYNYLISPVTDAEASLSTTLTSFNSNGFSVGSNSTINGNSSTNVGWQWQAGQGSSSSNTDGSITTTVSKNTSAGFSIATYTGTGSTGSLGHGLGVTPSMIIIKKRSASQSWFVNHASLTAVQNLYLNATDSVQNDTIFTARSSFTVSIGTNVCASAETYVMYCWAAIAGYSAFGSYVGNASTDGPFIYTGFRPSFVITKSSSAVSNWEIEDYQRGYNGNIGALLPNDSAAESSGDYVDLLSNGFKIKTTSSSWNNTGQTYIYMAFAQNPFKNALAR